MALGLAVLMLTVANVGYFWGLQWERSQVSDEFDLSCESPSASSSYTPSYWRWWPPGRVCVRDGEDFKEPSAVRAALAIALPTGLISLVGAGLVRVRRRWVRGRPGSQPMMDVGLSGYHCGDPSDHQREHDHRKPPYNTMRQPLRPMGLGDHGCPIPQWRRQ